MEYSFSLNQKTCKEYTEEKKRFVSIIFRGITQKSINFSPFIILGELKVYYFNLFIHKTGLYI